MHEVHLRIELEHLRCHLVSQEFHLLILSLLLELLALLSSELGRKLLITPFRHIALPIFFLLHKLCLDLYFSLSSFLVLLDTLLALWGDF